MSSPAIELSNITAGFDGKDILKKLSLNVKGGSLVLVEGATGSGKTTLIKLLIGGLIPKAGFGRVVGLDLAGISPLGLTVLRRREGIVFQSPRFLDHDSALKNVSLPLMIAGMSRSECRARGTRALMDAGLTAQARKKPRELSGGEQARLQIARALIHKPYLLLADEPFAHLDPESAAAAEELIREAHRRGTTVIVTTHRPTSLTDRAVKFALEGGMLHSC